jgi:Putative threonine efflux protein
MLQDLHLPLVMGAALIATASPGPSTVAIASASMSGGRALGFRLAAGITCGSMIWSFSAAFGLATVMLANAWLFEVLRYLGAAYLIYLALRSARSALDSKSGGLAARAAPTPRRAFLTGLLMHLTNPKAILFFGALYSVGLPQGVPAESLLVVVLIIALQSATIFFGYAALFSNPRAVHLYTRLRRWFEATFAVAFGYAGLKLLTTKLQ